MLNKERVLLLESKSPTERREYIIAEQASEIARLKFALQNSRRKTLEEVAGRIDCLAKEAEPEPQNMGIFGLGASLAYGLVRDELNAMAEGKPHRTLEQVKEELLDLFRKKLRDRQPGRPDS